MPFSHLKHPMMRFVMILTLLAGLFGITPAHPARADTIIVTNTNDSGPGSLRQAILDAAPGDTITFGPLLNGQTITLSTQLTIDKNLTIDASDSGVRLNGGNTSRIMQLILNANVTISKLELGQGVASDSGGAIELVHNSNLTLENSFIWQNQAGSSGGAISVGGTGSLTVIDSQFYLNQASGQGGAISAASSGTVSIVRSVFTQNNAGGNGGAISASNITLIDSIVNDNRANGNGGAMYSSNLVVQNTSIAWNRTGLDGGAIALDGNGPATVVNSTIFRNSANSEGGAIMAQGNVAIQVFNSTFASNTATDGKEVRLLGNTSLNLHNTIFVCTTGNENCYSTFLTAEILNNHSILGIGLLIDYGLAEVANNGGPTETMALLSDSPLIDAGDDSICANAPVNNLDQRGVARPQGSHCDIGAYEDQSIIRYVKQDANGAGDGSSWANAHTDLQAALAAASPDEEIWVAAGIYKPTANTDRSISFRLKSGVSLYGGFVGTETEISQRDYENHLTVLSGDLGIPGDNSDNSYHVVAASYTNTSAILDGFTIKDGNANDDIINSGGGIYLLYASPSVRHVIFTSNYATFGGGMYAAADSLIPISPILTDVTFYANSAVEGGGMRNQEYSSPILTNVIFDSNSVIRTGGGMENFNYSNPALTNVTFINNTAGELGAGGGMFNWVGNIPILNNVTFTGNTAQWGGGMGNYQSSPILNNVSFTGNSANWYGGAMSNESNSNPKLTDVTFDSNTAVSDAVETAAGAMHNRQSSPILRNVTFKSNSANIIGGGMVNELGSSPDLVNVTFSNNSADYGGAITNRDSNSSPTLTHVTISNNTASIDGGAIANNGNPVIKNSILWGNGGGEIFNLSGTPVINYSVVQGGYTGTGNIDQDPLLGPLQDNGGFTQTIALGNGSPAINAGDDIYCPSTDQRGVTRPQGSHCDIGAYEYDNSAIDVIIDDTIVGSYLLTPQESRRQSYAGINAGPVQVNNTGAASIIAAERVIYKVKGVNTSFAEMMGLPESQLDNVYWLPWYNNVDLDTQLRLANVSGSPALVTVTIGGTPRETFSLAIGESVRKSYAGVNSGPVKIESDQNIVAAERVIYKVNGVNTSFSEMMASPASQLNTTYWLPWYNNVDLDTQLRIANVSDQTATVTVTIGNVPKPPISLAAGESTRVSYAGVNHGPVQIVSDQDIVAAERVIYKVKGVQTSFSEMMALPDNKLDTTYWLPWYNNVDLDTQLRFANVGASMATVHIYVGGVEMSNSPFTLAASESTRQSFPGINNGPVQIVSNVPIVAAERVIYKAAGGVNTSFSEMMALPDTLLDAIFWFPWYNNVDLDAQLRFGVP